MKLRTALSVGRKLMRLGALRILIVDDEEAYFTPVMLEAARAAGYSNVQREYRVTSEMLWQLFEDPPDIVILDIMGIAESSVAKDGAGIALQLQQHTSAYVAVTSAHQFHLRNIHREFDYVIEERLLTAVDFIAELDHMCSDYYQRRRRLFRRLTFRVGRTLIRWATLKP